MSKIPSYRKVYMSLKRDIKDNVYPKNTLIPTEPELEKLYAVSRTTIRRAVEILVSEGYLRPIQGRGTEVLDVSTVQKLNHITSVSETLMAQGYKLSTQGMCIDRIKAPTNVADALGIQETEEVFRLQRVQYADGKPIAIMTNYIREKFAPDLDQYNEQFVSLYRFLEEKYNVILDSAVEGVTAISADFTDSQILQVDLGTPLLYTKRTSYVRGGAIEYAMTKLIADRYEFLIYLYGRP